MMPQKPMLATKSELAARADVLRSETKSELVTKIEALSSETKSELVTKIEALRSDIRSEVAIQNKSHNDRVGGRLDSLAANIEVFQSTTRANNEVFQDRLENKLATYQAEMKADFRQLIVWVQLLSTVGNLLCTYYMTTF
jgi:chromosomal replication initiation ATPase DnaA